MNIVFIRVEEHICYALIVILIRWYGYFCFSINLYYLSILYLGNCRLIDGCNGVSNDSVNDAGHLFVSIGCDT